MHNYNFRNHFVSLIQCIFNQYIRTYLLLLYASFLYGLKLIQLFDIVVRNNDLFQNTYLWWFSLKHFSGAYNSALVMCSLCSTRDWNTQLNDKSYSDLILKTALTSWLESKLKRIWHILYFIFFSSLKLNGSRTTLFDLYEVECKSIVLNNDFENQWYQVGSWG